MRNSPVIFFCKTKDSFGELSNFYPSPIRFDERVWPTVEHLYQASKFLYIGTQEKIRLLPSPMGAAIEGHNPNNGIRSDWESIKEWCMANALHRKFKQNPHLKQLLLSTEDSYLAELSYKDNYWGTRPDMSGQNRLGQMLMTLRASSLTAPATEVNFSRILPF
jgi:ribA/ribD-fused uncharacterized protein